MQKTVELIRATLKSYANAELIEKGKRFFKEDVISYGVSAFDIQKISKKIYAENKPFTKAEVLKICDQLWESGIIEESFVACHWSNYIQKQYLPEDFQHFDKWIKNNVSNWATCDTLCNHTVGDFVMQYPEFTNNLKEYATNNNRWVKRAAAVTLIIPARKGLFLQDIFEIADLLLTDADDMVQKGYGWMLKVASESHQQEVFEYVVKNKSQMPRTALRYAIEKMPKEMKAIAMKK